MSTSSSEFDEAPRPPQELPPEKYPPHAPVSTTRGRIVDRNWNHMTIIAVTMTMIIAGNVEALYRWYGYRPSVADTPAIWAWHRARVDHGNEGRGVVLLGSSRILTGFSTDAFLVRYPHTLIAQLGVPECSPLKMLDDLAADVIFRGVVICELTAAAFLPNVRENYGQQTYIDYSHQQAVWSDAINVRLEAAVQQSLCIRSPQLALDQILYRALERGTLPEPANWTMRFDRSQQADYRTDDVVKVRGLTIGKLHHWYRENVRSVPTPDDWLQDALRVESAVRAIQSRGGRVVFVRFPSTGATWELENESFPKPDYWDRFAARTSATSIHFRDVSTLATTDCPDTSHIDYRDAPAFTNHLLDELERRGVFLKGE